MLTAVDHLVVRVADVAQAVATYRNLGFTVTHGEDAEDAGYEAAYVAVGDFHIEFRAKDSRRVLDEAASGRGLGEAERIPRVVLRTDDLDAELARLKSNGFPVSDPVDDPIIWRQGSLPRRTAVVHSDIPVGLVEQDHTPEQSAFEPGTIDHPNTAAALERTYIAVESIDRELDMFEKLLGMSAPEPEMGTVIMSMMSVFYIGGVGVAVAEPRGPGPTADALRANGPGAFQVLFRGDHLDRAAAWMVEHGAPPPIRGTRLSGESALLVEPAHACNLYVAFAGQP